MSFWRTRKTDIAADRYDSSHLAKLTPMPKIAKKLDIADRFVYLDCVSIMALKRTNFIDGNLQRRICQRRS